MGCLEVRWTQRKQGWGWPKASQACSLPVSTQRSIFWGCSSLPLSSLSSPCPLPLHNILRSVPTYLLNDLLLIKTPGLLYSSCSKAGKGGHLHYSIASKSWRSSKVDYFVCLQFHQVRSKDLKCGVSKCWRADLWDWFLSHKSGFANLALHCAGHAPPEPHNAPRAGHLVGGSVSPGDQPSHTLSHPTPSGCAWLSGGSESEGSLQGGRSGTLKRKLNLHFI